MRPETAAAILFQAVFAGLDDKSLTHRTGHASVTITKDRYSHVTDESIIAATAKLDAYYEAASD